MNDAHKYDDIINLPHHVSERHPQMSALDRAAQFSPFAALTGHAAAIKEAARLTEDWMELDENSKEMLDERLQTVREHIEERPEICITYFRPDERKYGGTYLTVRGRVKKVEEYGRKLCMEDGAVLSIENIFAIEGELFREME